MVLEVLENKGRVAPQNSSIYIFVFLICHIFSQTFQNKKINMSPIISKRWPPLQELQSQWLQSQKAGKEQHLLCPTLHTEHILCCHSSFLFHHTQACGTSGRYKIQLKMVFTNRMIYSLFPTWFYTLDLAAIFPLVCISCSDSHILLSSIFCCKSWWLFRCISSH